MKPLKLKMNAFSSYADLQTIDFTALGNNGLYLITGETGSGKTTIFDAISFALFGKASGVSRGDYTMLRSDFADTTEKTFVELDFAAGNETYSIKRSIKKTGQDVILMLPDGTSTSGDRNIKDKIYEIVGLDREQFAQIVMIAQNDFLRFLQSGTDDRLKILRRIFGTEALKNFQEQLKARAKSENEKRDFFIRDFNRYDVDIYKRDEQFAGWELQIKTDRAELSSVDKSLAEHETIKQNLTAKFAIAEELNKKFSDLASSRFLLKEHESMANETEACKKRAVLGETALRKVKPLADEAARARANHTNTKAVLEAAKKMEAAALLELEQADNFMKQLPPLTERQNSFTELSKKAEAANEQLKKLKQLQRDQTAITEKQNVLSGKQSELETLNTIFVEADAKYKSLEEASFLSQAGNIAKDLVDGEPCPVCGSAVHPYPAKLHDDVTEAELKEAKETKVNASAKREEKSLDCTKATTEIETLSARFLADLSEYTTGIDSPETKLMHLLAGTQKESDALHAEKKDAEQFLKDLSVSWESAVKRKTGSESAYKSALTLTAERYANEQNASKLCIAAEAGFKEALQKNGFSGEAEYAAALISEDELADITKRLTDYEKNGDRLNRDINRLENEINGKEPPDLEKIKIEMETAVTSSSALSIKREEIKSRLDKTESRLKELRQAAAKFEQAEKSYAAVKQLADTANGKLDFETYAQMVYFERVLLAANQRLKAMSQNRYTLQRKAESSDGRIKTGLEIEAFDAYTGKARSANSLSGGESFMASLSLALGLSDVVQQCAGGIRLDAMFIDEGFGTLDTETLDIAIKALTEITIGRDRIIGIISHVTELGDRVDKQIQIEKTSSGSRITMIV